MVFARVGCVYRVRQVEVIPCHVFTVFTIVQSAVLRLDCISSVRLSVCDFGVSGAHRLEILKTNCTDN